MNALVKPPVTPTDISVAVKAPTLAVMTVGDAYGETVSALVIDCQDMLDLADETLGEIKAHSKKLEAQRAAGKEPILTAGRNWDAMFKPAIDALNAAETALKDKMAAYMREQQRIAAEQQRLADEAAEKERKRLSDEAERVRKQAEAEAAAKREAAMQTADDSQAALMLDDATATEQKGEAQAAAVEMTAAMTVAAHVAPAVTAPKGIGIREVFKGVGFDLMATIRAVADGTVPAEVLCYDEAAINKLAAALKRNMKYPGIRIEVTDSVIKRGVK